MDLESRGALQSRGISGDVSILSPENEPRRPESKPIQYRPPPGLIEEIDDAAKKAGLSRNKAMTQLLRFALDAAKREQQGEKRAARR
jgi:hypothetical protein